MIHIDRKTVDDKEIVTTLVDPSHKDVVFTAFPWDSGQSLLVITEEQHRLESGTEMSEVSLKELIEKPKCVIFQFSTLRQIETMRSMLNKVEEFCKEGDNSDICVETNIIDYVGDIPIVKNK